MESIIKEEGETISDYPMLMESQNGQIVLFTGESKGTLVARKEGCGSTLPIGVHCTSWAMWSFKPFRGQIILKG